MPPKPAPKSAPQSAVKKVEISPWSQYLPNKKALHELLLIIQQQQVSSIVKYMTDPASHPDVTAQEIITKFSVSAKGKVPVAKEFTYKHVDGFDAPALYQSPLIRVETNMDATRIGGRGIIAQADIQPGTLLLCEYIRHPFQQGLTTEDGTPIRSEVEFLQEFCFDFSIQQQRDLLHDLAPLFPFTVADIEEDHKQFLLMVYGELIEQCVAHSREIKEMRNKDDKNTTGPEITQELLLRLICLVHFNSFPSGILLHTSMVNHNCQPNAVKLLITRDEIERTNKYSAKTQRVVLHKSIYQPKKISERRYNELRATRFIQKGEEIFISYIPQSLTNLTLQQRQAYLYKQFRFKCLCETCMRDLEALNASTQAEDYNIELDQRASESEDWIDELSRNYLNLTKHNALAELEHAQKNDEQNAQQSNDEDDEEEDSVNDDDNNIVQDFRQQYGLPPELSIQTYILLQTVATLYPLLSTSSPCSPIVSRLREKCHKLITLVSKDVLEQLSRDVTLETASLLLYLYMVQLFSVENDQKSPLLPWNGMIQFSSALADHYAILHEDDSGVELTCNNNNNGTKYLVSLTHDKQAYNIVHHEIQPVNDNWTLDLLLRQYWIELNKLIDYNDIFTSKPVLIDISGSSKPENFVTLHSSGNDNENTRIFIKLWQLLHFMKPLTTMLLSQYTDRIMASLHCSVSTIGLISSIFDMKTYIEENKNIVANGKIKIPLSTIYNDLIFSTAYYLQNLLPHNAYASKILRLPLLQELIGKTPAEANKFEETAMDVHRQICELYNQCPIEQIVKGI